MNILNLRERIPEFYGSIYYGEVLHVEDPTKQGRIKVNIPEIYGDTAEPANLPWIYPLGYSAGLKLFNVPDLKSEVGVIFVGDYYTGFYGFGKFVKDQSKIFDEDYPNVYGIEDMQGNYVTVNKVSGEMKIHHLSGTEVSISKEGKISVYTPEEIQVVSAKAILTESESITIKTNNGNIHLESPKMITTNSESVTINASGTVNVKASKVNLGSGGKAIARVGDTVQVGDRTGTIISGGTNTSI